MFVVLFGPDLGVGFKAVGVGSTRSGGIAAGGCCGGFGGHPRAAGCAGSIRSSGSVKTGSSLSTLIVCSISGLNSENFWISLQHNMGQSKVAVAVGVWRPCGRKRILLC